jgi:hypothetical protein
VTALQVGHPIIVIIEMEADDSSRRRPKRGHGVDAL